MFAENDGKSKHLIIALFLHDIGHLLELEVQEESSKLDITYNNNQKMGDLGSLSHESKGRYFLESMSIPYPIPELVENHVKAKRFLVTANQNYYNKLSNASKQTLEYQGGRMTPEEMEEFKNDPLFTLSIELRKYDEMSKVKNINLKPLSYYKKMIKNILI